MRLVLFTVLTVCLGLTAICEEEALAADAQYLGSTSAQTASQPGAVPSSQTPEEESGNLSAEGGDDDDFAEDAEADVEEEDMEDEAVIDKDGEVYEESEEE